MLVDCVAHGHAAGSEPAGRGLLALAPSMQQAPADDGAHDCALISFCPSKRPMRVVHERISQLFHEIRLDELCSLTPATTTPAATPVARTR